MKRRGLEVNPFGEIAHAAAVRAPHASIVSWAVSRTRRAAEQDQRITRDPEHRRKRLRGLPVELTGNARALFDGPEADLYHFPLDDASRRPLASRQHREEIAHPILQTARLEEDEIQERLL